MGIALSIEPLCHFDCFDDNQSIAGVILLQLSINAQERARLNALIMASTIALSSPFGYLAGCLSSLDRRLPFIFTIALFILAMLVTEILLGHSA